MAFLICVPVNAQFETMPGAAMGIVRGKVVAWAQSGRIEIREEEGALRACRFDRDTDFEREGLRVGVRAIAPGDAVEMVADREPGGCYARTVEAGTAPSAPRGDFRFGGLVIRRQGSIMTVRTAAGEIHVTLRDDTRYRTNGIRVHAPLLINRHVFVRAGRNASGDLEAYQVMWGDVLAAN